MRGFRIMAPRRIALTALLLAALPAIGACQPPANPDTNASTAKSKGKVSASVSFERETNAFSFSYDYPAEAAAIPALVTLLDQDRSKMLTALEQSAAEGEADAKANSYPFNPHMAGMRWKVTGTSNALLVMLGEISSFSGGAHGNSNYQALLWDKAASRRIPLEALFIDSAAAMEPLRERYCNALNAERLEKRGGYEPGGDAMFNECPPFEELVIIPFAGSDGGFDRLLLVAAPYVAGPYVEGAYEISLPLGQQTLAQIKPEYRPAFTSDPG